MTKKRLKRFGLFSAILMALLMVAMVSISSCVSFDMKQERVDAFFAARSLTPRYESYEVDGQRMYYVDVGDEDKPMVVFVHGSPGAWNAFISYMGNSELLARARLISVDRPGFGRSGPGVHEPSMARQAAVLKPILEKNRSGKGAILVGHSLGGPVIAQAAMDEPGLVSGLILVAASIDPTLEKTKWYQIPADWRVISWMLPKVLVVTNREILPLKGELTAMLPRWPEIRAPVTVIHGGKDRLVPVANADFAERVLVNAPVTMVRVPAMNHFVPWNRPDLIKNAILDHLDRLSSEQAGEP